MSKETGYTVIGLSIVFSLILLIFFAVNEKEITDKKLADCLHPIAVEECKERDMVYYGMNTANTAFRCKESLRDIEGTNYLFLQEDFVRCGL